MFGGVTVSGTRESRIVLRLRGVRRFRWAEALLPWHAVRTLLRARAMRSDPKDATSASRPGAAAPPGSARHELRDHTGEVEIHVEAATLPEIYAEAARALAEIVAGEPVPPAAGEPEIVTVQAADREALLCAWLDELIFRGETRGRVYPEVRVDELVGTRLRATIRGTRPETLRTQVKAATLHRLRVAERGGRFSATVVLDV